MTTTITEAELLDAVRDVLNPAGRIGQGMTVPEMARQLGITEGRTRRMVRRMLAEGKLLPCQVQTRTMAGYETTVVGYRIA